MYILIDRKFMANSTNNILVGVSIKLSRKIWKTASLSSGVRFLLDFPATYPKTSTTLGATLRDKEVWRSTRVGVRTRSPNSLYIYTNSQYFELKFYKILLIIEIPKAFQVLIRLATNFILFKNFIKSSCLL